MRTSKLCRVRNASPGQGIAVWPNRRKPTVTIPSENLYLSVDQVSSRFSVSKDSIWRWRRDGEFPAPVKLGGRTTRWRLSDIEAWESQCTCEFALELKFQPEAAFLR